MNHVMSREQFKHESDPLMKIVEDRFVGIFAGDIVGNLRGATNDLRESNDAQHRNEQYASDNFIQTATAGECLHIIKRLIERVSDITGLAPELEDAACSLEKHIAWEASRG